MGQLPFGSSGGFFGLGSANTRALLQIFGIHSGANSRKRSPRTRTSRWQQHGVLALGRDGHGLEIFLALGAEGQQ